VHWIKVYISVNLCVTITQKLLIYFNSSAQRDGNNRETPNEPQMLAMKEQLELTAEITLLLKQKE